MLYANSFGSLQHAESQFVDFFLVTEEFLVKEEFLADNKMM